MMSNTTVTEPESSPLLIILTTSIVLVGVFTCVVLVMITISVTKRARVNDCNVQCYTFNSPGVTRAP